MHKPGPAGGGGGVEMGLVEPQMMKPPLTTEPSVYQVIVAPAVICTLEGPALPV